MGREGKERERKKVGGKVGEERRGSEKKREKRKKNEEPERPGKRG